MTTFLIPKGNEVTRQELGLPIAQLIRNPPAMQETPSSAGEGIGYILQYSWASLVAQLVKNLPIMQEDLGLIPGLERSPGEEKGYSLQYSGLQNSMDCIAHRVAKRWARLRDFHFTFKRHDLNPD